MIVLFALLAGSIAFSLGGMIALKVSPSIVVSVAPILSWLMMVPTWIYIVSLPLCVFLAFLPALGPRRSVLLLLSGAAVGAAAELLGTSTGLPFGRYAYTDFLGPKIAGLVPWAIPPSWYAAALLAFALASSLGLRGSRRVVTAAIYMVLWDVALEPAMSAGFPIWTWSGEGVFYGMPLMNWFGWFVTALVIEAGFERVIGAADTSRTPWTRRIWLVNGLFAVGICAQAGLGAAALLGAVAIALPLLAAGRRSALPAGVPASA